MSDKLQSVISALVKRQSQPLIKNAGRTWLPPLILLFAGILALIVFSGLLSGVETHLRRDLIAVVLWLLYFVSFGFESTTLWVEDAKDGTLDQDFIASGPMYVPLIVGGFLGQVLCLWGPLTLMFSGLWVLGVDANVPLSALLALIAPLLSLRMVASAFALQVGGLAGAGNLFFLGLSSLFLFLAVAERSDLIWALGLIFAPICLMMLPFMLSLSRRTR